MLRDALNEMLLAYQELGKEVPLGNMLLEQVLVELDLVGKTARPRSVLLSQWLLSTPRRRQPFDLYSVRRS